MEWLNQFESGEILGQGIAALVFFCAVQTFVPEQNDYKKRSSQFAGIGFVAFVGYTITRDGMSDTQAMIVNSIRGLILAGFLYPLFLLLQQFLSGILGGIISGPIRYFKNIKKQRTERQRSESHQRQQKQNEANAERQRTRQAEIDKATLERRELERKQQHLNQQRLEELQLECEVLYSLREVDICDRFSRSQFQQFVDKYLRSDIQVEVAENRAKELKQLIEQHFDLVHPAGAFKCLEDLATWYKQQQKVIENLEIEEYYKQDLTINLNCQFSDFSEKIMDGKQ